MRNKEQRTLSIGTEVEAHVIRSEIVDGSFHHDGSVDVLGSNRGGGCDGSCTDDCCCYDNCDCEQCMLCDLCSDTTEDCCCIECMTCNECEMQVDDCECDWKNESCQLKEGIPVDDKHHECEYCKDMWTTHKCTIDCGEYDHIEWNCERECGCECQCECDCDVDDDRSGGQDGEIVSSVLNENTIERWLDSNKNAIHTTNRTCGMHVHIGGLTRLEYSTLMTPAFTEYIVEELREWGKQNKIKEGGEFYKRLSGTNTYCRDSYRAEEQKMDMDKNSSRYCIVNYCWALHQTVEIRVLPSFQMHKLRYKAIAKVIDIVHTFIDNNNKPKIHSLEIKEVI